MAELWAGDLYGTRRGKIFLEVTVVEEHLSGILRLSVDGVGVFRGEFNGNKDETSFEIEAAFSWEGSPITLSFRGDLSGQGSYRGRWEASTGDGGIFDLHPHSLDTSAGNNASEPVELITYRRDVGVVRLFADDFTEILNEISHEMPSSPIIATVRRDGAEKVSVVGSGTPSMRGYFRSEFMKLYVQGPDRGNIVRSVLIELNARGQNFIQVQGTSPAWVRGQAEALSSALRRYEARPVTFYKKHGLTLNSLLFLILLVTLSDIQDITQRLAVAAGILVILSGLFIIHQKIVPNFMYVNDERERGESLRIGPNLVTLLVSTLAAILSGLVLYYIVGIR